MRNLQIYVVAHKEVFVPESPFLCPIQAGSANGPSLSQKFLRDDAGENISNYNQDFSEMTALYWIWKHAKKTENIGLFHYRRYLCCKRKIQYKENCDWKRFYYYPYLSQDVFERQLFDWQYLKEILEHYPIVIPKRSYVKERNHQNVYALFSFRGIWKKELDYTIKKAYQMFPGFQSAIKKYASSDRALHCNMFLMRYSLFDEYCSFLFPLLLSVYEDVKNGKLDTVQPRIMGYLAEFFTGVFITYKMDKVPVKELNGIFFERTDGREHKIAGIVDWFQIFAQHLAFPLQSRRRQTAYRIKDWWWNLVHKSDIEA